MVYTLDDDVVRGAGQGLRERLADVGDVGADRQASRRARCVSAAQPLKDLDHNHPNLASGGRERFRSRRRHSAGGTAGASTRGRRRARRAIGRRRRRATRAARAAGTASSIPAICSPVRLNATELVDTYPRGCREVRRAPPRACAFKLSFELEFTNQGQSEESSGC